MASDHNSWEFNCPQYVDFHCAADDNADSYFDVDHESEQPLNTGDNGFFSDVLKSVGKKSAGKVLPEMKIEALESPALTCGVKRKPLGVLQPTDENQRKNYEFRTTPYRKQRSKSYCSASVDSRVSLTSIDVGKNSNQEKQYNLRMTPAREKKSTSCFKFYDADLENVKKCTDSRSFNHPDVLKSEHLSQNSAEGVDPVITPAAGTSNGYLKRSASPEHGSFMVKRMKSAPSQLYKSQKKFPSVQSKKPKTTEEKELMKIKEFRHQLTQQRIKNEKYMNKAINADFSRKASDSTMSQHTVIKPFHFKTDERIKNTHPTVEYKHVDFLSLLRRQSPRLAKSKTGLTKFQPFHFETDKRKAEQDSKADYQAPPKKRKIMSIGLPQTPSLTAVKRNRPVTALSRQQTEELEVQEMRKYRFHAREFDPSVFAKVALPAVSVKSATVPEEIELATEKRLKNRPVKKSAEEKFEFHAQPAPKQIFAGPTGVKWKTAVPPTEPKSPEFALKLRSQKWKEHPGVLGETNDSCQISMFKAHPVPEFKAPAPMKSVKKCTVIEPFSFDQKDQERAHQKEKKLCEEIEKQKKNVPNFKAQPIPDLSGTSGIPKKEAKPVTEPEPFQLQIDKLATQKIDKWQKEIEKQLAEERKAAVFKATPASVIKKPPFQPEKSTRPLTVSSTIHLATGKRAEERAIFEQHMHDVEEENRQQQLLLQEEKEKQEKEEILLRRKETVHKAQPIKSYKPVQIKPSEKPLTQPSSPRFATSLRVKPRV